MTDTGDDNRHVPAEVAGRHLCFTVFHFKAAFNQAAFSPLSQNCSEHQQNALQVPKVKPQAPALSPPRARPQGVTGWHWAFISTSGWHGSPKLQVLSPTA